jgi:uncharacterized Ntn-hydrolase superfamily protein
MSSGPDAAGVVAALVAGDAGRDVRQLHAIGVRGAAAAYTGAQCIDWCGHVVGEGFSVAGNMLAGARVVEDTADAYARSAHLPLAERLLAAMDAGEAAGGDKRGRQAAALRIATTESYPFLDLRVDDHAAPLGELRRLLERSTERYQPFLRCLPSRANPTGIVDRHVIEREIEAFQASRRKTTDNRA